MWGLAEDWLAIASEDHVHGTTVGAVAPHCLLAILISVLGEHEFGDLSTAKGEG